MIKVLHVIPAVAPRYGGPSTNIWPMTASLAKRDGLHVEIATTDADGPGNNFVLNKKYSDVPVNMFKRTWTEQWKYSKDLYLWLKQNLRHYDVAHIHGVWSYSTYAAASLARKLEIPYIIRPAGMFSKYCLETRGLKKKIYYHLMEKRTIQNAAAFHCTSSDEYQDTCRMKRSNPASCYLISMGLSSEAFANILPIRQRKDRSVTVLFMGRLHPVKGIVDNLLPALKAFPQVKLIIAGGVDALYPHHQNEVAQQISNLSLAEQVTMLGPIEGDDRWALFDSADIFVLPSHSENFGIVVAEAMARGCPVLVTQGVASAEHVLRAGAGVVTPISAEGVAEGLKQLMSMNLAEMAAAGRRYAQEHFDWDKIAIMIEKMYVNVLKGSSCLS